MFNVLEGDGLIENIYHLLWTKDSIFGSGIINKTSTKIRTINNYKYYNTKTHLLRSLCYYSSHSHIQIPKTLLLVLYLSDRYENQKEINI